MALWIHALLPFLWPMRNQLGVRQIRGFILYWRDYFRFRRLPQDARFPLRWVNAFPCLVDRFETAGTKPRHYFHQDLWAAKKIFAAGRREHFDFGSRLDGFVAHCASFCVVHVLDIRPMKDPDPNIRFRQADLTDLRDIPPDSLPSISSLHVFEHIGLGRYGDPLGAQLLDQAVSEVTRVLAPGGDLYFSVPIGIQRLEFNGQRVFAAQTVIQLFANLELVEFSAINDQDDLILDADLRDFSESEYSCGLFHFRKPRVAER